MNRSKKLLVPLILMQNFFKKFKIKLEDCVFVPVLKFSFGLFSVVFLFDIKSVDFYHPKKLKAVGEHQVVQICQRPRKNFSQMIRFNADWSDVDLSIEKANENKYRCREHMTRITSGDWAKELL